ncbi:MAG: alanine:cation symporter family protein [Clostridiales bacterium]|nr:alanine:cation symporter family protein [Clostridiales bacterium]
MTSIFQAVNRFFEFIVPITDFLWDFPTNFKWYANIPILGRFTFAILLLVGSGFYFTFKTRFVQVRMFKKGLSILVENKAKETGISPLAAFMLSSAMRIGPGNIMGVTGAISVGGPGALFWMWFSAFLGMATAFSEAVLAQLFKEKKGNEYVGGLPYYGAKILGKKRWVGILLSVIFMIYALFGVPGQTFHVFTSIGSIIDTINGSVTDRSSTAYYILGVIIIVSVAAIIFGGLKRVTSVTDRMVPVMAIVYFIVILTITIINIDKIPYFISSVIKGAFKPEAIFGGGFGIALSQGIKRGLMSNEAGQGTITMSAAVSDNNHPVEQGLVQSLGVFLDTMIICTMTGFIIGMAHIWTPDSGIAWSEIQNSKLSVYLTSVGTLVPGTKFDGIVQIILSSCYAMFAFTTLIGLILFAEIAGSYITKSNKLTYFIRCAGALLFVPFGAASVLAGLELGNIWYISDFVNIMVVYANVPILLIGAPIIFKCLNNYISSKGERFNSIDIGIETAVWTEEPNNK